MIFLKGEKVPAWLASGPDVTFGCDVRIESRDDGYVVRPRHKLNADECLIRAKDIPYFPRKVILWHEPLGSVPAVDIYSRDAAQDARQPKDGDAR